MKKFAAALLAAGLTALALAPAQAQTDEDLRHDGPDTANVLTYGMGYAHQRFSNLDQITKDNIKKLVPVWSLSLENDLGEQAQPVVQDGVMYVSNARWTVAIDAITGKQLWRTPVDFDPETPRIICCGVSNKGVALYKGMVLRGTLDAHLLALDQKTGKEIWRTKVEEWKNGYSITGAPVVANGVLLTGVAGAEFAIRGFVAGYDPETGKLLWKRYTTAAPDEKGGETWPVKDSYLHGGGSTWITGSYDPELDLTYWGTGNAAPWNPKYRGGDSLWTASVIALRPKTGELVWYYQFTPNDTFDYDAVSELILADLDVQGRKRKTVMQMNRNGFLYVLDRSNGQLLAANAYTRMNWASHVDMKTGRPVETEVAKALRAGGVDKMWPGIQGGRNWNHAAFNPKTGLMYSNALNQWSTHKQADLGKVEPGKRWMGVKDLFGGGFEPGEPRGFIIAVDPLTAKMKWKVPLMDHANWSSMLATTTGLLFTGRHSGEFIALDAETGQQLWQFQTSSGINASPITWAHNGKQYVTVLSGLGGQGRKYVGPSVKNIPLGGSVWTFALHE